MAFSQNTVPTLTKQPRLGLAQIANADASTVKTVVTAGANGSKVVSLWASSTELTANNRDVQVSVTRSAVVYILTTLSVPFSSGFTTAVPGPTDLLSAIPANLLAVDNDGQRYLFLESGDTLGVASLTTVTSGKTISVGSSYADF
jgi:hypothetical protein